MNKICICISTSYDDSCTEISQQERNRWNNEIYLDKVTVREVFSSDHDFLEIEVRNVKYKDKHANDLVDKAFASIQQQDWTECHIVLNTHGAAGMSDLSDEVVRSVVKRVSDKNIKVTQLSALQCNGFRGLTAQEVKQQQSLPFLVSARAKMASLFILHGRLTHLETKVVQNFSIRGFKEAYDPISDKNKVIEILKGQGGESTKVETRLLRADSGYDHLKECIEICRDPSHKDYEKAANTLGGVMKELTDNIKQFLDGSDVLKSGSKELYDSVNSFRGNSDKPSVKEFQTQYKSWLKHYKLFSDERLAIVTAYCDGDYLGSIPTDNNNNSADSSSSSSRSSFSDKPNVAPGLLAALLNNSIFNSPVDAQKQDLVTQNQPMENLIMK